MIPVRLLALTAVCHIVAVAAVAQPAAGEASVETEGLAELSAHLTLVRTELEFVRREMGRPEHLRSEIRVLGAEARTIFAQALTLSRKADRLSFELARQRAPIPPLPTDPIEINHVPAMVDAVLERVRIVKTELGITEAAPEATGDPTVSSADLLRSMLQASRQLNLLLERRFSSSDVFQQVTVAISYTARLLQQFPDAEQIPDAPGFERFKRPSDVYLRLLDCFELLGEIARMSEVSTLDFEGHTEGIADLTSSDVYDLASLLVSELAYLDSRVASGKSPIDSYYPGRKLPSHTYQRVGILKDQLTQLVALVTTSPGWLTPLMPQ